MRKNKLLSIILLITVFIVSVLALCAAAGCAERKIKAVSLELNTAGAQTVFGINEEFTPRGLEVTAELTDGKRYRINASDCGYSVPKFDAAGEKTVKVRFMGAESEYKVSVIAVAVNSLELDLNNVKTKYVEGDTFSTEGIRIKTVLNHGKGYYVKAADCEISGYDTSAVGNQIVTVSYAGASATYGITVDRLRPETLEFDFSGLKTLYKSGEALDTSGMKAQVVMNNGVKHGIDASAFSYSAVDLSGEGNKEVKVTASFQGDTVEASYNVCVLPKSAAEYSEEGRMSVFTNTSDNGAVLMLYVTVRTGGGVDTEDAASSGWYVLRNKDGSIRMYRFAYKYTAQNWSSNFGGCELETAEQTSGDYQQYLGVKADGALFVAEPHEWHYVVIGWAELEYITLSGYKTEYYVGDEFNAEGLVVTAHYYDGSEKVVTDLIRVSKPDMNKAGVQVITVSHGKEDYGSRSAEYTITVIERQ